MSRRRAFVATLSSGADLAARQLVQFVITLVLARLVTPAEFGTIALLAAFVLFGSVAADAGIPMTVLQRRDLTDADLDTAHWTSVATGLTVTVLGVALAAPLSALFGRPDLAGLAAVLALGVVAGSVGQVATALLVKRLQFGRLMTVGVVAGGGAGGIAIAIASAGYGLWALAVQFVAFPALTSIAALLLGNYHPRLRWNRIAARRLLRTGRWVLAANLVDSGYLRIQTIVLGTVFGPAALGRYQRADSTQQLAAESTSTVVGRVALPIFASSADRPDLLREGMGTGARSTALVNSIVMALMAALSGQLLVVLYGPQWEPAAPILSILCLAGLLWPLHVLAVSVLYSLGLNQHVFRIDLVKKGIGAVALAVGVQFGVTGVAWAQVFLSVTSVVVNGRAVHRAIGLQTTTQLREIAAPVLVAGALGAGIAVAAGRWDAPPALELAVLGGIGTLSYIGAALLLRLRAVRDLLPLLRRPKEVTWHA